MEKLETFVIVDVPDNIVSKVACTIATAKKMGIKVGWIDKVIEDTYAKRDHFALL